MDLFASFKTKPLSTAVDPSFAFGGSMSRSTPSTLPSGFNTPALDPISMAVSAGIALPRAGASLFETGRQLVTNQPETLTPTTPAEKFLFGGNEPISSLPQKTKELASGQQAAGLPKEATDFFAPFTAVGSLVLDMAPFGKPEKTAIDALTAEITAKGAKAFLTTKGVPDDIASKFAPLFAKTNTPAETKSLLDQMNTVVGLKQSSDFAELAPHEVEALPPLDKEDYLTHLQPKMEALPVPKPNERLIIYGGDGQSGQFVDTIPQTALNRGVNANTHVQIVPESALRTTGDAAKDARGERLLTQPVTQKVAAHTRDGGAVGVRDYLKRIKIASQRGFIKNPFEGLGSDVAKDEKIPVPKTETTPPESQISQTTPDPGTSAPPQKDASLPSTLAPEASPVQKLTKALQEAKPIRGQQEKLYSAARSQRAARVAATQLRTSGESGFFAELGQLKGELPKVNYESIRKNFTQGDVDSLFNTIKDSPKLDLFEQINARSALSKMLGAEGGVVPTVGELKLLNRVFPKDMIDALMAHRPFATKLWEALTNAANIPRSILSSFDLSAPLRQGVFFVGRKEFYKAFAGMFKQFGSEKAFQAMQASIAARPTFKLMKQSKLALTEMDRFLSDREERFMSNWAENIPLIGRGVKASGRAYVGFLNKLRADTFDTLITQGKAAGVDFKENEKALHDVALFINSATGRGDLGMLNKAAPALNAVFFSPRLMASRLNMLNPVYYVKLDPFVRKQAIKSLLSFAGIATTVLTLAKVGGASVSADPTNADFGKIKVGNTRFDILGGFQQYLRLTSQLLAGKITSSTTGKTLELGKGYKPLTRKDILIRFFQGKENPVTSFVTDFLQGQDAVGNPFQLAPEVVQRFVPLIAQDVQDALKEWGPSGALTAIPASFGVGTQTYGGPKTSAKPTAGLFSSFK